MAFIELHDADGVQDFKLDSNSYVLGRAEDCDIVLTDRRCSKQHCRLEQKGGTWRVVDLASANGTSVNGAVVSQVVLQAGDEIGLGDVRIVFHLRRPQAAPQGNVQQPKSAAERNESAKKKNQMVLVATLLVVLGALGFVLSDSDDEADQTRGDAVTQEIASQDDGNRNSSVSEQDEVEIQPSDEAVLLDGLRQRRADLERETGSMLLGDLLEKADLLVKDAAGTELETETARWRDNLKESYRQIYVDRCDKLRASIDTMDREQSGAIAQALSDLDELLLELRANELRQLERGLRKSKLSLLSSARGLWTTARQQAERDFADGEYNKSRHTYEQIARNLAGTNFESQAKGELRLFALRESIAKDRAERIASGVTTASSTASASSSESSSLVKKVTAAEKLAAGRKWKDAAQGYADLLTSVSDAGMKERWTMRRDLLFGLSRLKAGVIVGVNNENKKSKTVKIGRLTARPFAADTDIIQLKFGTGEVTWKWKEIPQGRLLDLLRFGVEDPETQLAYARAAIEFGNEKRAMSMLLRVAKKAQYKAGADEVYGQWRSKPVPPGGFIIAEGAFLTPEEFADYESTLVARKLAKKVESGRLAQLVEVVEQMQALGNPGARPLQDALRVRYSERAAEVGELKMMTRPGKTRQNILKLMDERRANAFALIFDTKKYPYPYGPDQKVVQAEVDGLVNLVRELYDQPSLYLVDENKALKALYDELKLLAGFMDSSFGDIPEPRAVLQRVDEVLDMHTWARSDSDRKYNEEVARFNAEMKTSITPDERECHDATNEYRLLMGLRAVKIEETLLLAARSHSQEMKDLGYFAHNSPTKGRTTPSQRAQLNGWGGSCSENIAQGQRTGKQAVAGWISSSGHHRNILGRGWTVLGCGKAKDGFYWTQNFAKGSSTRLSKEKKEDAKKKS